LVEFKIGQMEAGKKVHRLVRQMLPGVPLSGIYKMVRTGRIKLNGKRAKAEDIVQVDDIVRLYMADADYAEVSKKEKKFGGVDFNVDVVFEDAEMIVVNKPAGLLTHGAEGEYKNTLVNQVLAYLHHQGKLDSHVFTPAPVHRLDRNTSGLVVFAKTGDAVRRLTSAIQDHRMGKWYIAIVKGEINQSGEINSRLGRASGFRTVAGEEGKESETLYEPLCAKNGTTVVRIQLISGRTHQIRAHFSHIGHPLLGDVKYGGGRPVKDSHEIHQWLHAIKMRFPDGKTIFAPVPDAYGQQLKRLGYMASDIRQIIAACR
jgi:RluA family pseudouridine synthase